MGTLLQDIRYAARMIGGNPGFAAVVIVTMALGIGANTAMFSLVNTALLRPLPFDEPDRLVRVFRQSVDGSETRFFSYPDYLEYRDRNDIFENLAAFAFVPLSIGVGEASETRFGQIVTGNYFDMLRVRPALGRLLRRGDDERPGAHPVAVISHRYWQRNYGGDPGAVGALIILAGQPFTIVGVAPEGFTGAIPIPSPDIWVPMHMLGELRPEARNRLDERGSTWLFAMGRLKSGLGPGEAQASLAVTAGQLKDIDPEHYDEEYALLMPSDGIIPMTPEIRRTVLALSTLIMAMVGLILLVACANVANLLLTRSTARAKEIGIRVALGAGRLRLVRQLLTESVLLALFGGAAGLLLGVWCVGLLPASLPRLPFNITADLKFGIDGRMMAFATLVSLLAGLVFGLVPALGATKVNVVDSLKNEGATGPVSARRSTLRNVLVVGEVAISVILLIGAGLFVRSLLSARAIDPGFNHRGVLAVALDVGAHDYDEAGARTFAEQLIEHVRTVPGVESASLDHCPPLTLTMSMDAYWIEGRPYASPEDERVGVAQSFVSADNFKTLGITLRRGRTFSDRYIPDAPRTAIVNQAFVDRYWPDEDPLGKRISRTGADGPYYEVIGVTETSKYWLIGEDPRPFVYLSILQNPNTDFVTLLARTTGDPMAILPGVRTILRELNPDMSPFDARPLREAISFVMLPAKFAAAVFGLFGVLALGLASVGLYGVMSYAVAQRTREIGIRIALGAQRGHVLRLAVRRGLVLTLIGLGIGLALSLASTRVLSALLYEIGTTDPVTFFVVPILLTAVALLACYIPARRAAKVDPMTALRYE
jgi:predicted permease